MDPVTLLAAATAAYNGVKKAVELGREVHDIYGQLSTWAGHVGNLKDAIENIARIKKLNFVTSASQTADIIPVPVNVTNIIITNVMTIYHFRV